MSNHYDMRTTEGREAKMRELAIEATTPIADKVDQLTNLVAKLLDQDHATPATSAVKPTYQAGPIAKPKPKKSAPKDSKPKSLDYDTDVVPMRVYFTETGMFRIDIDPRAQGMATTKRGNPSIVSGSGITSVPLPWDRSKALWFTGIKAGIGENRAERDDA